MHALQPKHSKLSPEEVQVLLKQYNITLSQLPKIMLKDPIVPEGCAQGDVLRIERQFGDETREYFRVVV